jgi:hypothetical protein
MKNAPPTILLVLFVLTVVSCSPGRGTDDGPITASEGFEAGLGGWTPRAMDTTVAPGDEIDWSVSASSEAAKLGAQAAKFSVDNRTDAAKVWLERSFEVTPYRAYDLTLSFDFGTSDFGDFNNWTIIAGALPASPQVVDDLPLSGGSTSSGPDDVGLAWLPKTTTQQVIAGPDGKVYILVGVWGTWESLRVYYFDNVEVTLVPTPPTILGPPQANADTRSA